MKKENDVLKKTQETAQNMLEKGKEIVDDIREKADDAGINEKVSEIKDNLVDKAKDINNSKVVKNAKDSVQSFIERIGDTLEEMRDNADKKTDNAIDTAREKMNEAAKSGRNKVKEAKKMTREELRGQNSSKGKTVAGVALGAAAVAGAYTLYMNRKNQEESLRAEFSERIKKWHELDDYSLEEDMKKGIKRMTVRTVKMYPKNSNALLGEDIVVNITPVNEMRTFNPEEISEPINPMEDVKKKATELAKKVQERIAKLSEEMGSKAAEVKETAGKTVEEARIKTQAVAETVVSRAQDLGGNVVNTAQNVAEQAKDKAQTVTETVKDKTQDVISTAKEKAQDAAKLAAEAAENFRDKASEGIEEVKDTTDELKYKVDNVRSDVKEDIEKSMGTQYENLDTSYPGTDNDGKPVGGCKLEEAIEKAAENGEDIYENKSESEENIDEDNIVKAEEIEEIKKPRFNPGARNTDIEDMMMKNNKNIEWEEDKNPVSKAGEEIINAAQNGFEAFRKTLGTVKEQFAKNVDSAKKVMEEQMNKEEDEALNEETKVSEFDINIHNRGNKDYFFSPMLIQRYNSKTRTTLPCPRHEEGTTLEQRIIKPGETYTGKLAIKLGESDDSIIIFEDMLMNNAAAILLEDEAQKEFYEGEDQDLVDEILFSDEEEDI